MDSHFLRTNYVTIYIYTYSIKQKTPSYVGGNHDMLTGRAPGFCCSVPVVASECAAFHEKMQAPGRTQASSQDKAASAHQHHVTSFDLRAKLQSRSLRDRAQPLHTG